MVLFICDMSFYLDAVDISLLSVHWGLLSGSYLIIARVRAGRQVSRPEPESVRLVPRLNDLLLLSGRRRYLPIECTLGALIQVCEYLIVAKVRAGRQVSRPEPESAGLLP
ncbi:hypothetical protein Scep_013303 [Stephania cephalantha]|uniref:Uncharacterized protein n=1 Tax=Stephania cephalantha TaxID=152367 RepID=A0AAP0JHL5_9MAGN